MEQYFFEYNPKDESLEHPQHRICTIAILESDHQLSFQDISHKGQPRCARADRSPMNIVSDSTSGADIGINIRNLPFPRPLFEIQATSDDSRTPQKQSRSQTPERENLNTARKAMKKMVIYRMKFGVEYQLPPSFTIVSTGKAPTFRT